MSVSKLIEFETNPQLPDPTPPQPFKSEKIIQEIDLLSLDKTFFGKKRSPIKVENQKNSYPPFGNGDLRLRCNSFSPELRNGYKNDFLGRVGEKGRVSGEKLPKDDQNIDGLIGKSLNGVKSEILGCFERGQRETRVEIEGLRALVVALGVEVGNCREMRGELGEVRKRGAELELGLALAERENLDLKARLDSQLQSRVGGSVSPYKNRLGVRRS
jgi:hypothetical protein